MALVNLLLLLGALWLCALHYTDSSFVQMHSCQLGMTWALYLVRILPCMVRVYLKLHAPELDKYIYLMLMLEYLTLNPTIGNKIQVEFQIASSSISLFSLFFYSNRLSIARYSASFFLMLQQRYCHNLLKGPEHPQL